MQIAPSEQYTKSQQYSNYLPSPLLPHHTKSTYSNLLNAPIYQIIIFQFMGMFLFVYGITSLQNIANLDRQLTFSFSLAVCFSAFLCGAHLNPMITFMNYIRKDNKINFNLVITYVLAQITGGMVGALLGHYYNQSQQYGFLPLQDSVIYLFRLGFGQAVGSFIFVFFVMLLTNKKTTVTDNQIETILMIASFLYIGRRFTPFSGMSLNITISFIFAGMAYIEHGETYHFRFLWIYLFGDLLGMTLATKYYDWIHEPELIKHRKQQQDLDAYEQSY